MLCFYVHFVASISLRCFFSKRLVPINKELRSRVFIISTAHHEERLTWTGKGVVITWQQMRTFVGVWISTLSGWNITDNSLTLPFFVADSDFATVMLREPTTMINLHFRMLLMPRRHSSSVLKMFLFHLTCPRKSKWKYRPIRFFLGQLVQRRVSPWSQPYAIFTPGLCYKSSHTGLLWKSSELCRHFELLIFQGALQFWYHNNRNGVVETIGSIDSFKKQNCKI